MLHEQQVEIHGWHMQTMQRLSLCKLILPFKARHHQVRRLLFLQSQGFFFEQKVSHVKNTGVTVIRSTFQDIS